MDNEQIQKILNILYPELKIIVNEVERLPRQQLNENNEWVKDSDAYFVGVKMNNVPNRSSDISEIVSIYTGYEFNIYRT